MATGNRPGMNPRPVSSPNAQPASTGSPSRPATGNGNGNGNGNGSYGRNGSGQAGRPAGQPGPGSAQSPRQAPTRPGAPAGGADPSKESLRNKLGLGQKQQPGVRPSAPASPSANAPGGAARPPAPRPAAARQPGTPVARANQPGANQPAARPGQPSARSGQSPMDRTAVGRVQPVEDRTEVRTVPALAVPSPNRTAGTAASAGSPNERARAELGLPPKAGTARRTRKARLRLSRLDPWSVMKTSFLFSISAGIVLVVAVYAVWTVLQGSGLFDSVNTMIRAVTDAPNDTTPFQIEQYVNTPKVMGVAALIACVDVVILTALATLGSFLYNLAATMLGGLEVTLAED